MLSMLAGHKRYAHIAALRCDAVLPESGTPTQALSAGTNLFPAFKLAHIALEE